MAVRIRMKRLGRRKRPFYRLVAIDSKINREGAEIEKLGWFDPLDKKNHFNLNEDRIKYWLTVGASASYAAKGLFKKAGLSYKWHLENNGVSEKEIARLLYECLAKKAVKEATDSKSLSSEEKATDKKDSKVASEELVKDSKDSELEAVSETEAGSKKAVKEATDSNIKTEKKIKKIKVKKSKKI